MKLRLRARQSIIALFAGALVATVGLDRAEASRTPAAVKKIVGLWKLKSSVSSSSCPGIAKHKTTDLKISFSAHGNRVTARVNGKVRYRGLAKRRVPVSVTLYSRDGRDSIALRAYRGRLNGTRLQVVKRGRALCAVQSRVWSRGSVVREAAPSHPDTVSNATLGRVRGGAPTLTAAMFTTRINRRRYLRGVESCHAEVLAKRPRARGNVRFKLTLGAHGRVRVAKAKGINPSMSYCVETVMRGWRFPGPGPNGATFAGSIRLTPQNLARDVAAIAKRACRCKNSACAQKTLGLFAKFLRANKDKQVSAKTSRAAGKHSRKLVVCLKKAGLSGQTINNTLIRASRSPSRGL